GTAPQQSRTARASCNRSRVSRAEPVRIRRGSSHLEDLRVALLDRLGVTLHANRIFLHQLDIAELPDAGLLDRLLVRGILPRIVDQNLLTLAPVHPIEEQPRRVRIGRGLEHRAWT